MQAPGKLLAIALGGHATIDPHNPDKSVEAQEKYMEGVTNEVLDVTSAAAEEDYNVALETYGSGPQTGLIMKRAARSEQPTELEEGMPPLPLRYASMDLIGSLGMTFQLMTENRRQQVADCLGKEMLGSVVVPTSFIIDPRTMKPTKPVGEPLNEAQIRDRIAAGLVMGTDIDNVDGRGMRVLVPSPELLETFTPDLASAANNIRNRLTAFAGGTGGRALERLIDGFLVARNAVIDKDRAMRQIMLDLLRQYGIEFDTAIFLTDAEFMVQNYALIHQALTAVPEGETIHQDDLARATAAAQPIHRTTSQEMRELFDTEGAITGGAIAKIDSACTLLEQGAVRRAIICNPQNFGATLLGQDGTGTDITLGETWG